MKKLYILLFTILISGYSFGQVILAEGFDYPDGSLVPNGGWANISGTPGDLLVSSGKAVVEHGTPSEDASLSFSSVSGDVYFAFDFSVDDLGAPWSGSDSEYFAHVSFRARMDIVPATSGGDYTFGISSSTSTAQSIWTADLTFGQIYRIVLKFDQVTGTAQIWIDPTTSADTSISGNADGAFTVSSFDLRQSDSSENETVRVDDLMIGQTFNDVLVFSPPTEPSLTLLDAEPSGSTVTVGPEDLSGDFEFAVANFAVGEPGTGTEGDGYISWQILNVTDGGVHDSGIITDISAQPVAFNTLLPDKTYQVNAILKDNTDADLTNPEAAYTLTANTLGYIDVTSVADLRAVTDDGYYRLTNEAFLTFQQSFRGQKFIQDATGGILIDDVGGVISSTYAVNDGITNIRGQVSEFGGMKQFVPSTDYGAPSSSDNIITPQTVTLAELTTNAELYESELVEVVAVTIDNSTNTTFLNGQVYAMSQSSDNFDFRTTFFDVDYIGANVPTVSTDVVGIINERSGNAYYLSARDADDISGVTLSNDTFEENNFKVYPNPTSLGYVTISSKNSARMNVTVFDILGKQVLNETVSNNILNVSSLTSGVYIMKISQDEASITKKLVIQ